MNLFAVGVFQIKIFFEQRNRPLRSRFTYNILIKFDKDKIKDIFQLDQNLFITITNPINIPK